jgi:hypothetical protein
MPLRKARKPFVLLALATSLLGLGGLGVGVPAHAQDAGSGQTGESLFGSYDLEARGTGVQARYEVEGLLPGGAPVLDLTLPETLARFGSGPTGYGLASLAYPGGILVNLSSLISQSGADGSAIPDYPVKAEAFYPSGPTQVHSQALGDQSVLTNNLGVDSRATFPSVDADPVISVASVTSASRTTIEDGKAVARTRVVLGGVRLLGGVITIGALTTDLVAAHDGTTGKTDGGTTATGVKFLGLAAELTPDGLVLDKAPAATGPASPLGTALDPLLAPLKQLTAPIQALVQQVLKQAVPSLDDVLGAAGIHLELLKGGPVTTDSGASAYRSTGLSLSFTYKGTEQEQLGDLIESIPPALRPSLGPLPNPISFLVNNHIAAVTLGTGTVSALASAPFDSDLASGDLDLGSGDLGGFTDGGFTDPGFSTPLPTLPGSSAAGEGVDLSDVAKAVASSAVPVIALLIALALAAGFGIGSTALADNVLAATSTSCPTGRDQPPAPPRDP